MIIGSESPFAEDLSTVIFSTFSSSGRSNIVFKRINNELKWSDSNSEEFNDKELGKVVGKTNDSYKFNNINNKWSLTLLQYEEFIIEKDSSQNIHVSHKLGSDCFQIDEKLYKNFIENGKV